MNTGHSRFSTQVARLTTSGARATALKSAWGIADQALISATNFATMVLVARTLSPREFGLYSLAYTSLLIFNSFQASLIIQPHTTLGAPRSGPAYRAYTTDILYLQGGLATVTAVAYLIVGLTLTMGGLWVAPAVIALAAAAPAWQCQEFPRRAMYVKGRTAGAFANDIVSYGGQLLVLLLLFKLEKLTPVSAILAMALTSTIAALLGVWQIRDQLDWHISRSRLEGTLKEHWGFGKWLLGGDLAYWTSGQIYPIFAAALVSVTMTGIMRAAQTIIGPTNVLMSSLDPMFSPKAARTYAVGGLGNLRDFLKKLQLLVGIVMGAYCITVAIFAEPIFLFVYGPEYAQHSWMVSVVALAALVEALRAPIRIGLKSVRQTQSIFRSFLASSVTNLTAGIAVVYFFGSPGIALGLLLYTLALQISTSHYQRQWLGGSLWMRSDISPRRKQLPVLNPTEAAAHGHHSSGRTL